MLRPDNILAFFFAFGPKLKKIRLGLGNFY